MELWKDIPGYEGRYQVSNEGRVRSLNRLTKTKKGQRYINGVALTGSLNKQGYRKVKIGSKIVSVHRLVAIAFIPNPDNKPEVNHKDLNQGNNKVENLEWMTHRENSIHAWRNEDGTRRVFLNCTISQILEETKKQNA